MISASLASARGSASCVLAVLLVAGLMPAGPPVLVAQEATLIVAGRLLDPASGIVTRDQEILVEHGRIALDRSNGGPTNTLVVVLRRRLEAARRGRKGAVPDLRRVRGHRRGRKGARCHPRRHHECCACIATD